VSQIHLHHHHFAWFAPLPPRLGLSSSSLFAVTLLLTSVSPEDCGKAYLFFTLLLGPLNSHLTTHNSPLSSPYINSVSNSPPPPQHMSPLV
jgi:hypothetical protein